MTKVELVAKLKDVEWDDFEAKEAASELPKSVWETVSAFSNASGGWIVLGVKQTGKKFEIVGVKNPEKVESDFLNTVRGGQKLSQRISVTAKKHKFLVTRFHHNDEGSGIKWEETRDTEKNIEHNSKARHTRDIQASPATPSE